MRIGHTFMIATVLILAITANTYAAEQNHDVTVEPNLPPVTMPSTSVNQLGQVIMAVNDDDIDTNNTVILNEPVEYKNGMLVSPGQVMGITPAMNYGNIILLNGQSALFLNTGGAYISLSAGATVNLKFDNVPSAILEIGYINSAGTKFVYATTVEKVGGVNLSIKVSAAGSYEFYAKNYSSDPITISNGVLLW